MLSMANEEKLTRQVLVRLSESEFEEVSRKATAEHERSGLAPGQGWR